MHRQLPATWREVRSESFAPRLLQPPIPLVRPLRFHDLRHTAVHLLFNAGLDVPVVQAMARHRDPKLTVKLYGHLRPAWVLRQIEGVQLFPDAARSDKSTDKRGLGATALKDETKKPTGFVGLSEREKGFEPSTLALAIHSLQRANPSEIVQESAKPCDLAGLTRAEDEPTVQARPEKARFVQGSTDKFTDRAERLRLVARALDVPLDWVAEMARRAELTLPLLSLIHI